jgi:hypothetical protein
MTRTGVAYSILVARESWGEEAKTIRPTCRRDDCERPDQTEVIECNLDRAATLAPT